MTLQSKVGALPLCLSAYVVGVFFIEQVLSVLAEQLRRAHDLLRLRRSAGNKPRERDKEQAL